ncbi:GNAT family protein [Micromonospora sp. WMMD812]|uniref:GNAT family N-acetyltransferase n=1 Tax=Micromonospora sp. WMMD812 TaxID=3015152 RepID=UPI00248D0AF5|nr:GNAT family protein [Micromonospora sp. WMMD812]WBB68914.1 GNAT family protein [Micromonospora sp. WMMD812]
MESGYPPVSVAGTAHEGGGTSVRLRPVTEPDLAMFRRFLTEPGLIGLDWGGFRDAGAPARRFAADGWLGEEDGRLIVEVGPEAAVTGFVSYRSGLYGGTARHWEIGIALLPEWRGRGIGWRAQALICDYLFAHSPAQRIQAGTHPENIPEQRSLEKAGFRLEGVVRACEFRAGRWRDGYLYSRLRDDPSPWDGPGA